MIEASRQQPPLTVCEVTRACARLDVLVSEATVKRLADSGVIPCVRTGRGVRLFQLEDVRAFAEARRR
jgi:excisionase family DNA binding protein